MAKACERCGLLSPTSASRCDCGFLFGSSPPVVVRSDRREVTVDGVTVDNFDVDAADVLILVACLATAILGVVWLGLPEETGAGGLGLAVAIMALRRHRVANHRA